MATIRYLVHDVDAVLPFYKALGFEEVERWGPPFAMLRRDDLTLWVSGPGTSAQKPMPDGAQPAPGDWNRLVLEVDDLAQAMAQLRAAGATFRNEPVAGPGGTQVLAVDPSGNPVEVFQARGDA
jgi:catechol 2,3-dioxygenase-like lactoylglutathione lyase family enzyme